VPTGPARTGPGGHADPRGPAGTGPAGAAGSTTAAGPGGTPGDPTGPTAGRTGASRPGTAAAQPDRDAPAAPIAAVPTAPVVPAAAPAPAASTPAAVPVPVPSPAAQLAAALPAAHRGADGIHRLTVHLNPDELGPVSVLAEIRGGEIHVHLAGGTEVGREALRAALPELRRELQDAGFTATSLDVQQDAPGYGQPGRQHAAAPDPHRAEPDRPADRSQQRPTRPGPAGRPGTASRRLDVSL
jgi:hypothetical protein